MGFKVDENLPVEFAHLLIEAGHDHSAFLTNRAGQNPGRMGCLNGLTSILYYMSMHNPELQLARDFVRHTSHNVFLTGKAGTGKTTFLHGLKQNSPKRMIVTAPTGVAAINAGGVTLHSFFQLPFGPFVPGGEIQRQAQERGFNRQKREIIESLDLLVIDEISMVRSDLLDAVDFVLRRQRRSELPFGGVQLLMIGDLHQLSPVVRTQDWDILKDYYASGYFFSSRALRATPVVAIELKHIYRQSDAHFIELLNRVRDNRLDAATLERLNTRYLPDFSPEESDGYIILTTHNRGADHINETRLHALASRSFTFEARIEGDYPVHSYPAAETLTLKKGAQVMFVRNDGSSEKRYFNGKIGTVIRVGPERVVVRCPEGAIAVEPVTWDNIAYRIDRQSNAISEEVIGRFTQYPLRLAWAITIHKSQGLTFERAIIDAAAAFSHGQVYVALSRCKTFEGMVLMTPISRTAVMTDRRVSHYVGEATRHPPTREQLDHARALYQHRLLQECWDFDSVGVRLKKLLSLLRDNRRVMDLRGADAIDALERQTIDEVVIVSVKFRRQLQSLCRTDRIPQEDDHLQERVRKASAYFTAKLQEGLLPWLRTLAFETDNKALGKRVRRDVKALREALAIKTACIDSCREGFSSPAYLNALANARICGESSEPESGRGFDDYAADVEHPALLDALRKWRSEKQREEEQDGVTHYQVLTRALLRRIADALPDDPETLLAIRGIGKPTRKRYGGEILDIVSDYCRANDIEPASRPRPRRQPGTEPRASKDATRLISLRLYQEGLSITQIAERRSLKATTVEGHLAHYIRTGELSVREFIDDEKIAGIAALFAEMGDNDLGPVKRALGDDGSYGELKMVRAHLQRD
jgi:hypothetical protein